MAGEVSMLVASPNERQLAAGNIDGSIRLWNLVGKECEAGPTLVNRLGTGMDSAGFAA